MEILKQGAEATLYKTTRKKTPMLIKKRVEKGYRIKELDDTIRKTRTRKEALLLVAARKAGVNTPIIYDIDLDKYEIIMQYIKGSTVKEMIDNNTIADQKNLCQNAGTIHLPV